MPPHPNYEVQTLGFISNNVFDTDIPVYHIDGQGNLVQPFAMSLLLQPDATKVPGFDDLCAEEQNILLPCSILQLNNNVSISPPKFVKVL